MMWSRLPYAVRLLAVALPLLAGPAWLMERCGLPSWLACMLAAPLAWAGTGPMAASEAARHGQSPE
ncbi:hypothetical protein [Streptomyces sp. NPDC102437]|uniref:hypothetical protein n=1 Tax=Streptomyces sp. NPDC102437 TaxID=3366175 RepID=UPI00382188A1